MITTKTPKSSLTKEALPKLVSNHLSIGSIPIRNFFISLFVFGLFVLFAIFILNEKLVVASITGIVLLLSGFVISNLFYLNGSNKHQDGINRLILESSTDLFLTFKIKKRKFNFASSAIHELLGFDAQVVNNHYDLSFIHPADRLELRSILDPTFLRINRSFHSEVRFIKRDGNTIWVHIKGDVVVDEKNELDVVVLNIRDINAQKEKELMADQYRKSLEQVIQKHKISEKNSKELSSLLSSHDLKEPLRTMSNYTRMVQQRYTDQLSKEGKDLLQYAVDAANRMAHMMDDILAISLLREDRIRIREVNLEKVISDVMFELTKKITSTNAVIQFDNLPKIQGDFLQIKELIKQIIDNGIKYRGQNDPLITLEIEQHTDNWLFKIIDNGIGITEEFQDSIFNFFRRLQSIGDISGSGLGLAICKKIVTNHGGSIWVESEGEGRGSSFCFTIPVEPETIDFSTSNKSTLGQGLNKSFRSTRFQL